MTRLLKHLRVVMAVGLMTMATGAMAQFGGGGPGHGGGGGGPGHGGGGGGPGHGGGGDFCGRFNGQPYQCEQQWQCQYDYRFGACFAAGGGGGGGGGSRECYAYDRDPQTCNAVPGCSYDFRTSRCEGGGGPQPQQCGQIVNPRQCDRTPGCEFDYRAQRCRRAGGGGGGGGGQVQTTFVSCSSSNYQPSNCPVPGLLLSANLIRQESRLPCIQGQSWGTNQFGIWVTNGCRAQFQVSYRIR